MKILMTHRLTPARAGNTLTLACEEPRGAAHPRSRGEHYNELASVLGASGSPPLARGTHIENLITKGFSRLTPARAGNTGVGHLLLWLLAAHPRSRGEHVSLERAVYVEDGSPPLARGTRKEHRIMEYTKRLTPARAGNTIKLTSYRYSMTAHPRSRGEHIL